MIKIGKYSISISTLFSWIMKSFLLLLFFYQFYLQNFLLVIGILIALGFSLTPAAISRSYKVNLPWLVDFSVTLAVFLHILGLTLNLYHDPIWWWWDLMTHFLGTAVIAFLAFLIIFTLDYTKKVQLNLPLIAFFTCVTALAIGALWEIGEYYFDWIFGTNALIDLPDTIHDLMFDFLAGLGVSILGVWYINWQRKKEMK